MNKTDRKILIVGGGIAGLTSAIYLLREGYKITIIEKNTFCGGLLTSIKKEGFLFDMGARAILNSGILKPMLEQIEINLDFFPNPISIGIENEVMTVTSKESLIEYQSILEKLYPESKEDIQNIISIIKILMDENEVLYGMDNPLFKNIKEDKVYRKELLKWLPKFLKALRKVNKMNEPFEDLLSKLSSNQSLNDLIGQSFFKKSPASFALGYFYVYLDYLYPKGGTGALATALIEKVKELGGNILYMTEISKVIPAEHKLCDTQGTEYIYDKLIWCADLKTFYRYLISDHLNSKISTKISQNKREILSKYGAESVYSVFIAVDEPPKTFESLCSCHFFYTASKKGLGQIHLSKLNSIIDNFEKTSKDEIFQWLNDFCKLNTYEISIPVLRDSSNAPEGKTGLIISILFEYKLLEKIKDAGWYDEFTTEVEKTIVNTFTESIFPFLKEKILFKFSTTPIDLYNRIGTSEGSIVGWSYEQGMPVESKLNKIKSSVITPIPDILQAGQWVYSPSGITTAILTGFFAAKRIIKKK